MPSKAVLFDMDGTLFDSERLWDIAIDELASLYGAVVPAAVRLAMVGRAADESMLLLHEGIGQQHRDPLWSADWVHDRVEGLFRSFLEWRPGAQSLVEQVRAVGLPHGLVTSTNRRLVKVALGVTGPFDIEVCGDEVANTKPHPEPYLTAAAMLGVDPRDCLVFEDSPSGVASAVAAGMQVIAVPLHVALPPTPGVRIIDSLVGFTVEYQCGR